MARYIDADALLADLKELREFWGFTFTADGVDEAIDKVEEAPTADVAPRAEVAILSFQKAAAEHAKRELQYEIDTLKGVGKILDANLKKSIPMAIEHAKEEVAREIFVEIEADLRGAVRIIEESEHSAEIKKAKLECYADDMLGYIAELKKKYIGEQKGGAE